MVQKLKKDKRGFTLVELIVVIAILGVLAAVLVPQYIQYVEKARKGVDESFLSEVAHVMELSYAGDENVSSYNTGTTTIEVDVKDGSITVTSPDADARNASTLADDAAKEVQNEIDLTFPTKSDLFKSKTYNGATVTITMTKGITKWDKLSQAS